MPEVSIIIPTYNRANFLIQSIQSVLNQTFTDFELIVVDDGSIDDTKKIVWKFVKKDKRIKYIYQENSGGTAGPRNTGIKYSAGNYLAFLDSDDQWLPEKLEEQVSFLKKSKDEKLGFIGCGALAIKKENEEIIAKYELPLSYRGNIFNKILKKNFILTPSGIILKKEILKTIGNFDENFKMITDWDLWIRISKNYNFDFINKPLFKYYVHNANITKTISQKETVKDFSGLLEKHKEDYLKYLKADYVNNLRHLANSYCKLGDVKLGRKYFIKTIKTNWLDYKSYFYFLLSFFGSKFYNFCIRIKRQIFRIQAKKGNLNEFSDNLFRMIFEPEDDPETYKH